MSTRFEDTDREVGKGVRRDVREAGRNVREAGGDIISNWCGLWSNLLSGVSDAISPRSRSGGRSTNVDDADDERSQGLFFCDGGEFRVSCGRRGSQEQDDEGQSRGGRRRTAARYADRDREVDIRTQ